MHWEVPLSAHWKFPPTDGSEQWKVQTTQVNAVKGVHDLYLLFKGGDEESF